MDKMIYTATVTTQGQITIPAPLRKQFFPTGSKVVFSLETHKDQEIISLKSAPKLADVVGIATKQTGKKLPPNFSLKKTIQEARREAANNADQRDQKIISQLSR